jgi:hypothetical protein
MTNRGGCLGTLRPDHKLVTCNWTKRPIHNSQRNEARQTKGTAMNLTLNLSYLSQDALKALVVALLHKGNTRKSLERGLLKQQAQTVILEIERRTGWAATDERNALSLFEMCGNWR